MRGTEGEGGEGRTHQYPCISHLLPDVVNTCLLSAGQSIATFTSCNLWEVEPVNNGLASLYTQWRHLNGASRI